MGCTSDVTIPDYCKYDVSQVLMQTDADARSGAGGRLLIDCGGCSVQYFEVHVEGTRD